ncbi:unnamed protein product [Vitrella brassicaformis CCMP3155]|uniref:RING-type domain-containing protein n=1 Tax=Vitrella brassicaformis (strain CCMP3155) TaxID=1169540 RepID=A0A0G4GB74_VITBC|nr:unnamed protein product [Vitrella brassicaformis CCMP3155]|eukprot:CEM26124.1 unnamed protein product [Vitrella brassicaformis CCMP3155]
MSVNKFQTSEAPAAASAAAAAAAALSVSTDEEEVEYWSGNPSIEITNGKIKYWRTFPPPPSSNQPSTTSPSDPAVVLASRVPSHTMPTELLDFITASADEAKRDDDHHQQQDQEQQQLQGISLEFAKVLHGPEADVYLMLLLCTQSTAERLIRSCDGKAYNPLESDACRLHLVTEISITEIAEDTAGGDKDAPLTTKTVFNPPHTIFGKWESPQYCAVCLEMLEGKRDLQGDDTSGAAERGRSLSTVPGESAEASAAKDGGTGVALNVLCGHTFHANCLRRWCDTSCPVCRFQQFPFRASCCDVCGSMDNIHICLVCGFIGCADDPNTTARDRGDRGGDAALPPSDNHTDAVDSKKTRKKRRDTPTGAQDRLLPVATPSASPRPRGGHARQHYETTRHTYAIVAQTQRVWDYARDGYVHRLIQNKLDGKMVEVVPPDGSQDGASGTSSSEGGGGGLGMGMGMGMGGGGSSESEGTPQTQTWGRRVSFSLSVEGGEGGEGSGGGAGGGGGREGHNTNNKLLREGRLENWLAEFNQLLASQLDGQRDYYEQQLAIQLSTFEAKQREGQEQVREAQRLVEQLTKQLSHLQLQKTKLDDSIASLSAEERKLRSQHASLEKLCATLTQQQKQIEFQSDRQKLEAELREGEENARQQARRRAKEERMEELQGEVRDLEHHIKVRRQALADPNMQGGSVHGTKQKKKGKKR